MPSKLKENEINETNETETQRKIERDRYEDKDRDGDRDKDEKSESETERERKRKRDKEREQIGQINYEHIETDKNSTIIDTYVFDQNLSNEVFNV